VYRERLPQLDGGVFLTDGGIETTLMKALLPSVNVLGGCCGTDHRHVGAICSAWLA
jgi:hypothetical protein